MQKKLIRNGLIAAAFVVLMVFACMAQNVNATTSYESDSLDGYVYSFTGTYDDTEYAAVSVIAVYENKYGAYETETYTLGAGQTSVNLSEFVTKAFAAKRESGDLDNNTMSVGITVNYEEGYSYITKLEFIELDAQATVQDTVTEDTTFEYDVKAIVYDSTKNEEEACFEIAESKAASLAVDKITIKKGNSVSDTIKLIVAVLKRLMNADLTAIEDVYVIYELPNKYGYATSIDEIAVCANTDNGAFSDFAYNYYRDDEAIARKATPILALSGVGGAEGLVKELNALVGEKDEKGLVALMDKLTLLNAKDEPKAATFRHGGVQTADNADLGLWIALLAIAMVCGGAVALKRD